MVCIHEPFGQDAATCQVKRTIFISRHSGTGKEQRGGAERKRGGEGGGGESKGGKASGEGSRGVGVEAHWKNGLAMVGGKGR